jgi:hypothetical protein
LGSPEDVDDNRHSVVGLQELDGVNDTLASSSESPTSTTPIADQQLHGHAFLPQPTVRRRTSMARSNGNQLDDLLQISILQMNQDREDKREERKRRAEQQEYDRRREERREADNQEERNKTDLGRRGWNSNKVSSSRCFWWWW